MKKIVVDSGSITSLFKDWKFEGTKRNRRLVYGPLDFESFEKVATWILQKKICLVTGGKTYNNELKKTGRYLYLISELKRINMIVVKSEDDEKVNKRHREIDALCTGKKFRKFNDRHIAALCDVSKSYAVCTHDNEALPYLSNNKFYTNGAPRIIGRDTSKRTALRILNRCTY